jgi:hypothetical protein
MAMAQTRKNTHNPITFARLMRLGQVAHAQGDNRSAHEYWQKAAMIEPDNEQVWTALMWVLNDDEDRKVCLKNILTINPNNMQAKQMLDNLIGDTQPQMQEKKIIADVDPHAPQGIDFVRIIVLASIFGAGASIIIILLQMLLA